MEAGLVDRAAGAFLSRSCRSKELQEREIPSPGLRDRDSPPPDDSPVDCGVGMPQGANTCYASSAADQETTSSQIACGRAVGLGFLRCKTLHDKCLACRAYTGCISRGDKKNCNLLRCQFLISSLVGSTSTEVYQVFLQDLSPTSMTRHI